MVVFFDTNILIDYLDKRKPFSDTSEKLLEMCENRNLTAYISTKSILDIFYILRKDYSAEERKDMLLGLCETCGIVGVDRIKVFSAITNERFSDLEDCVQSECAKSIGAEYIITRDINDFVNSEVSPILPNIFLQILDK
jgi:predicted nucleic acid-binding protein